MKGTAEERGSPRHQEPVSNPIHLRNISSAIWEKAGLKVSMKSADVQSAFVSLAKVVVL